MATMTLNVGGCSVTPKFGLLYNYYSIVNSRNIVNPSMIGFEVPTRTDYSTLVATIGSTNSAYKLRTTGLDFWKDSNGLDTVGFRLTGDGLVKSITYEYTLKLEQTELLTKTESSTYNAYIMFVATTNTGANTSSTSFKFEGHSVRLVNNSTTLSDGETGTYIGNDGLIYPTICIGSQEWLSTNLAETKYADGTVITLESDLTKWTSGDTSSRLTVYDDDWDNAGRNKPNYY